MGTEEKAGSGGGAESTGIYPQRFTWKVGSIYRTRDGRFVLITYVFDLDVAGHIIKDPEAILWSETKKPPMIWFSNGNFSMADRGLDLVEMLIKDAYGTGFKKD